MPNLLYEAQLSLDRAVGCLLVITAPGGGEARDAALVVVEELEQGNVIVALLKECMVNFVNEKCPNLLLHLHFDSVLVFSPVTFKEFGYGAGRWGCVTKHAIDELKLVVEGLLEVLSRKDDECDAASFSFSFSFGCSQWSTLL